jgi:hypothetical protein
LNSTASDQDRHHRPSIRAPLSTLPSLQVNATASYRSTLLQREPGGDRSTQIAVPVTRNYGDMRVDVGRARGVARLQSQQRDRRPHEHVIEPSFSVQRRTDIANQDRIPTVTGYDIIIGGVTQMSYGWTNRILVARTRPASRRRARRVRCSTSRCARAYYSDENASKFDPSYSYGYSSRAASALSPIALTARATPTNPLAIDYRLEYDPNAVDNIRNCSA